MQVRLWEGRNVGGEREKTETRIRKEEKRGGILLCLQNARNPCDRSTEGDHRGRHIIACRSNVKMTSAISTGRERHPHGRVASAGSTALVHFVTFFPSSILPGIKLTNSKKEEGNKMQRKGWARVSPNSSLRPALYRCGICQSRVQGSPIFPTCNRYQVIAWHLFFCCALIES